ncbi:MAG: hypothetical protein E7363_00595 [Clostridiales bacterium]|nr:hypothetical protein [Clostridiales bacterium]
MIFWYDGTENGFFTLCYDCYLRRELPTRILRGKKASTRGKQVITVSTSEKKANAFRALLKEQSPTLLGETALALRRLDEGVPLAVIQYAFSFLFTKKEGAFLPKNPAYPFMQFLQMAKLELARYGGILQFFEKNGGFYAEIDPVDDVVDLLLIGAIRKFSAPTIVQDVKRNKWAVWNGKDYAIFHDEEGEEPEILTEENASFFSLLSYLTPKKKPPMVTQLCLFSETPKEQARKSYLTLFGKFYPVKNGNVLP